MSFYRDFHISRPTWVKFGAGDLHGCGRCPRRLWAIVSFVKIRAGKAILYVKVVNEISPIPSTLFVRFEWSFVKEMSTTNYWVILLSILKIGRYISFYSHFPHLLSDMDAIHITPLSMLETSENWRRESHTLLMGVNENTFTCAQWNRMTFCK